jgi:hypothetical protein
LSIAATEGVAAMAIKGLSRSEKEAYILSFDSGNPEHPDFKAAVKAETPTDRPTTFYLGNLTQADRVEIGDITTVPTMNNTGVSMSMQKMKRTYLTVQRGLKGWDNFTDEEGQPIVFESTTTKDSSGKFRETAKDECLQFLDTEMVLELCEALLKKNGMVKEIEKNSEGASPLSLDDLLAGGLATSAPTTTNSNEDVPPQPD